MKYISVVAFAEKYGISERTARNYCAAGKIEGTFLTGKTWNIPADAALPAQTSPLEAVSTAHRPARAKAMQLKGGIYHYTQIDLTYNSNHIEGSRLTHDQTRYIFGDERTVCIEGESVRVDDIIETTNHFRCIDLVIDRAEERPTESLIKEAARLLKSGTSDSRKEVVCRRVPTNGYPTKVGGNETTTRKRAS